MSLKLRDTTSAEELPGWQRDSPKNQRKCADDVVIHRIWGPLRARPGVVCGFPDYPERADR
jgi:hypothetical protein